MNSCFIISPFSDNECNKVFKDVYKPLCQEFNLEADRLDESNNGQMVMLQIIDKITNSKFIIADLTLARPNCYFEVGYAMGAARESRLFLTCKEDHYSGSEKFSENDHQIHFDLQGYDITFWDINDLESFYMTLNKKITNRMKTWSPVESIDSSKLQSIQSKVQKSVSDDRFQEIKNKVGKE